MSYEITDFIDSQITMLKMYKNYNHEYALSLNTGDLWEYARTLIKYENYLVDVDSVLIDEKLNKMYGINDNNLDTEWQELTEVETAYENPTKPKEIG